MSDERYHSRHEWTLEALMIALVILVFGAIWHFVIEPLIGADK